MKIGNITIGGRIIGTVTVENGPPQGAGIASPSLVPVSYDATGGDDLAPGHYGHSDARGGHGHTGPGHHHQSTPVADHEKDRGHWPGHRRIEDKDAPDMGGEKVYGRLAEARDRARQELKDKPWLNDKAMHIFAGENDDPKASTALWEETINRAAVRGTSVEKELRHTSEGGYYAGWRNNVSPETRKVLEASRERALNHSNVSNYATDNSSGWLAEKENRTGTFSQRSVHNAEHFMGPDNRIASHQKAWRDLVNESETKRAADPQATAGAPFAPSAPTGVGGGRLAGAIDHRVDPRITDIIGAAATHLPEGYKVHMSSGFRSSGEPNHNGRAADFKITDPQGNVLSNRGEDPSGMYQTLARHAYGEQRARYPELNGEFAWGGAFGTQRGSGAGPRDLMHFDINGERGRYEEHQLNRMGPMPGVKYGVQQPQKAAAAEKPKTDKPFDPETMAP